MGKCDEARESEIKRPPTKQPKKASSERVSIKSGAIRASPSSFSARKELPTGPPSLTLRYI